MDSTAFPWFSPYSQTNDRLRGPSCVAVMQQSQFDQGQPVAYSSFFSQLPFGPPGFPFQDLDYHLQEGAANFRPSAAAENPAADVPTSIADAGELQKHMTESKPFASYPQRSFVDTEFSLFNHTMFQYPMPNMDLTHFPVRKEEFSLYQPAPIPNLLSETTSDPSAQTSTTSRHSEKACNAMQNCQVCHTTLANGLHFGARTCAACAAFFRRTISDGKKYVCKRSQRCNNPTKDATGYRKICRSCRLKRCMDIGMLPDNVQHKRCRRDSPTSTVPKPFNTMLQPFCSHIPDGNIPRISSSI
uniref:Nuclear receptor domain-containing protein n=1 Tax=Haemonchus contortus TaxID=6289 RepID=A0A7I4XX18_HAECO